MAWIESHSVLVDHRKIRECAAILGVRKVHLIGHLHCLWHKVIELAEDGVVTDWTSNDIAYYSQWDKDPEIFYQALLGRFIDEKRGEKVIHDWLDYAWKYLYRKYHTANPKRLEEIQKIHKNTGKPKRTTKGKRLGDSQVVLPNLPNQPTKPNQPTLPQGNTFDDLFWPAYPERHGKKIGKELCRKLYDELTGEEQGQAVTAANNYTASDNATRGFAVDPVRFFKSKEYPNGLWREWITPEVKNDKAHQGQRGVGAGKARADNGSIRAAPGEYEGIKPAMVINCDRKAPA